MSKMNTRPKTKAAQAQLTTQLNTGSKSDDIDFEQTIKAYEKTINVLKHDVTEKDKLIRRLTEEQDNNSIEFEKMCKQICTLKKEIADYENTKNDHLLDEERLEKKIQDLMEINSEYEVEIMKNIQPLKTELSIMTNKFNVLQNKYSALLIQSAESLTLKNNINKKSFDANFCTSRNKSTNRLLRTIMKLNKKIKHLNKELCKFEKKILSSEDFNKFTENQNIMSHMKSDVLVRENDILTHELQKRNDIIEAQQQINHKLLQTLERCRSDLIKKDKSICTLNFIEDKLHQINKLITGKNKELVKECIIDKSCSDKEFTSQVVPTIIQQSHSYKTNSQPAAQPTNKKQDSVFIFSDKCGVGLGNRLQNKTLKKIYNHCTPGLHITHIVNLLYKAVEIAPDNTYVLVLGEKTNIKRRDFITCLKTLEVVSKLTKTKLIVCLLPYSPTHSDKYNQYIYKLNCDIYNIASLSENIHVIDINNNFNINEFNVVNFRKVLSQRFCDSLLWNIDSPMLGNSFKTVIEIEHRFQGDCDTEKTSTDIPGMMDQCLPLRSSNFLDETPVIVLSP